MWHEYYIDWTNIRYIIGVIFYINFYFNYLSYSQFSTWITSL